MDSTGRILKEHLIIMRRSEFCPTCATIPYYACAKSETLEARAQVLFEGEKEQEVRPGASRPLARHRERINFLTGTSFALLRLMNKNELARLGHFGSQ